MSISSTQPRTRRILVIANETLGAAALHVAVTASARDGGEVLVVCATGCRTATRRAAVHRSGCSPAWRRSSRQTSTRKG